jgi:hypothetical protein
MHKTKVGASKMGTVKTAGNPRMVLRLLPERS